MREPTFEELEKMAPKGKTKASDLPDGQGDEEWPDDRIQGNIQNPELNKLVSGSEAEANMSKRLRGELPAVKAAAGQARVAKAPRPPAPQVSGHYDPFMGEDVDNRGRSIPEGAQQEVTQAQYSPVQLPADVRCAAMAEYMSKRIRVCMVLQDGTMYLPAIAIIPSQYSLTILLPTDDNNVTFIPKPGSAISVSAGGQQYDCYFPGSHFDIPELKVVGLVFIRKE